MNLCHLNKETGKGLPDASIMVELCQILKITVNDLLCGEKVDKENYQKKLEQNIIDTLDYSDKKVSAKSKNVAILIMFLGIFLIFNAFSIYPPDSSWASIHATFGLIISLIGFVILNKKQFLLKQIILDIGYFLSGVAILLTVDYFNVILNKVPPRFSYLITTSEDLIVYKSPLCNVYRVNRNTNNEYYIVDTKKEYQEDSIPISPFNRYKSGIDSIIQFKNKYIGNNSNDGLLIDHLPMSQYGYTFAIDSNNCGLTINYHITDWYINENYYLEKALLYNTISIFALIDNTSSITFNFSGNTYTVTKDKVKDLYPHFNEIESSHINKDKFNKYVENKMNDNTFVLNTFKLLFS